MRRKDREITDKKEILDIAGSAKVIRIAFLMKNILMFCRSISDMRKRTVDCIFISIPQPRAGKMRLSKEITRWRLSLITAMTMCRAV